MNYLTGPCQFCSGNIEFLQEGVGQQVPCPHCGRSTTLAPAATPARASRAAAPRPQAPSGSLGTGRRVPLAVVLRIGCGLALLLLTGLFLKVPAKERSLGEIAAEDYARAVKRVAETNSYGADFNFGFWAINTNRAENLARPRRFAAALACSIGACWLLSGIVKCVRPHLMLASWPALLSGVGLAIAMSFFVLYPTAVYVPPDRVTDASQEELNRWVENSGLLNNRLVGVVFGIGIALLGGVWAAVATKRVTASQPESPT